jgi:hypothetical protein
MKPWHKKALLITIAVQAVIIAYLIAKVQASQALVDLYKENRELTQQYRDKQLEACVIKLRLTNAYKVVLARLFDQLGLLGDHNSAAEMVLMAYDDPEYVSNPTKVVHSHAPPAEGGMGGP